MARRAAKARVTIHRRIAMLLVRRGDLSKPWPAPRVRLGPIYCADLRPYLIWGQLAARVSPQVNLFILTPGKGLLRA